MIYDWKQLNENQDKIIKVLQMVLADYPLIPNEDKMAEIKEIVDSLVMIESENEGQPKGSLTNVGKFLRKFRIDEDMVLGEMAKDLGIGSAHLSGIEHGRYELDAELVERIKQHYNFKSWDRIEIDRAVENDMKERETE